MTKTNKKTTEAVDGKNRHARRKHGYTFALIGQVCGNTTAWDKRADRAFGRVVVLTQEGETLHLPVDFPFHGALKLGASVKIVVMVSP